VRTLRQAAALLSDATPAGLHALAASLGFDGSPSPLDEPHRSALGVPADLAARQVIVVSPVVATANTAVAAIDRLKERGANDIRVVCMIASPEGVERLRGIHPDVKLWTAAIDDHLDGDAFIIPGLGDAGNRAYGTE